MRPIINGLSGVRTIRGVVGLVFASALTGLPIAAQAVELDLGGRDWIINLDTNIQYTAGVRLADRDEEIAGNPTNSQSDHLFDQWDFVTNRLQVLSEFQGVYQNRYGFRVTASIWKDWAFDDDDVALNPRFPDSFSVYPSGLFSQRSERFHIQGEELLDAYVFANIDVGEVPVSIKAGRLTQQWGNAFFFGFSNIAYSQHPQDFIKAFTQPGSELKELFLPRRQILVSADLSNELSITGQYFAEWDPHRFPEGGTYLAPADILFEGPRTAGPVTDIFGDPITAGLLFEPDEDEANNDWGLQVSWAPDWARGELSFYFRNLDEVQPWTMLELLPTGGGNIHLSYADDTKLYGLAYETDIAGVSVGMEVSHRQDTALNTAFFSGALGEFREGARGDIYNVILNSFSTFSGNRFWDQADLIAEISYTHLDKVTRNAGVFLGEGSPACVDTLDPATPGDSTDGCATQNALAFAAQFVPKWLQPIPSVNLSLPIFVQWGVSGNPAYAGGSFFAENSVLWSIGLSATYRISHTLTLQYNDYYYDPIETTVPNGFGQQIYPGGNGPIALNDKTWLSLTYKFSF